MNGNDEKKLSLFEWVAVIILGIIIVSILWLSIIGMFAGLVGAELTYNDEYILTEGTESDEVIVLIDKEVLELINKR